MTGEPGEYWFTSSGSDAVCSLYLIADVDKLVEFEIMEFDIDCEGQYQTFCGADAPARIYTASQNVANLQFRVPRPGQGFRVRVRFIQNFQPCNALAPFEATVFSLKNFGFRRNCTIQIVFPVNVLLLSANIGVASETGSVRTRRDRLSVNCAGPLGADYAALSFGQGLDTSDFDVAMGFCGVRSKPARRSVTLGCGNSAVSLHSSGLFFNSLRFEVSPPSSEELEAFLLAHPQCST
ncbi:corticotropin-releasing factor-binding protein-like [Pomacea canaliculata]|uniref:corticotropin-releasing factor-binding protein-like n=1 Tax=Pomacea canaliculata TaxID=400727 RepID=UPI000D72BDCE|nr:corticotropin-releasing factor-binding protein-like [Pomacea canaliculata]